MSTEEKKFPLTKDKIIAVCDPQKYGDKQKYPYINYMPFTKPSAEFIEFANEFYANKSKWHKHVSIKDFRALFEEHNVANLTEPKSCMVKEFNINNKFDNNTVNGHIINYKGSSISNGVIISIHGGCYCILSDRIHFGFGELLSKLTGCSVYLLNYKLSPEFLLPAPVNELIILYQYLLNEMNISSSKICFAGSSCGAGMILLALQSMKYGDKKYLNLPQPSCVWLNSPMTNLELDTDSYLNNRDTECLMDFPALTDCTSWCVGNKDKYGNNINNKDKSNEIYSPINGKFNGLSPMYIMVAAGEIMLDDSLIIADKAYNVGVNVKLDIEPFMMHVWTDFIHIYPEAYIAHSKAAQWIISHFNKKTKSKL